MLANGVVLTAIRLRSSFCMSSVPPDCFFDAPLLRDCWPFVFQVSLAQSDLAWVQSLLVLAVPFDSVVVSLDL